MSTKRKYTSTYPALTMVKKQKTEQKKLHSDADVKRLVSKLLRTRGLKAELKFFTTIVTGVNLNGTIGALSSLVLVAQGSDENNRVGDHIFIKHVEIIGTISSTNPSDYGFMALLCDKQPNGAATSMASDFNSTSVTPYNCSSTVAPLAGVMLRNMNAVKRYSYYREKSWSGNQQVATQSWTPFSSNFHFKKSFTTPLEVEYNNTTGVIGSVSTNNLTFGYSGYTGANTSISFYAQIHYTDL